MKIHVFLALFNGEIPWEANSKRIEYWMFIFYRRWSDILQKWRASLSSLRIFC
jgi:hypothetical protein